VSILASAGIVAPVLSTKRNTARVVRRTNTPHDHAMSSSPNGHNPPPPLQPGVHLLPNWQDLAIESYRENANVAAACRAAGIARVTFYKYLKVDPDFAARIEDAKQDAIDRLKRSAFELERYDPEFRQVTKQEHSGSDGAAI
jgi:hypothetical protein